MESPGEHLKRERELRGISLQRIFEATRAPLKYLAALEADDYEALPHPTFVKGYIRAYCKHLGLDENDALLRYEMYMREHAGKDGEAPAHGKGKPHMQMEQPAALPRKTLYIIGAAATVLIIIIAVYFTADRNIDRQAATQKAALPPEPRKPAEPVKPGGVAQGHPISAYRPGAVTEAKETAKTAPGAPVKRHTLAITAVNPVWVKVRIDDDEPLDVTLKEGEEIVWKAENVFSLIIGNAGGVKMKLDGVDLGALGAPGEVLSIKLPAAATTRQQKKERPAEGAPPAREKAEAMPVGPAQAPAAPPALGTVEKPGEPQTPATTSTPADAPPMPPQQQKEEAQPPAPPQAPVNEGVKPQ